MPYFWLIRKFARIWHEALKRLRKQTLTNKQTKNKTKKKSTAANETENESDTISSIFRY